MALKVFVCLSPVHTIMMMTMVLIASGRQKLHQRFVCAHFVLSFFFLFFFHFILLHIVARIAHANFLLF